VINSHELGWKNFNAIKNHLVTQDLLVEETSEYWEEESQALHYILESSPTLIKNLRDHCHWLTGVRSYEYKTHHLHRKNFFIPKYEALRNIDPSFPFYGEIGVLGDFGYKIENQMVNLDTLKFFESMMALNLSGQLRRLSNIPRPVILEIGAGWGGFLSILKRHLTKSQLVIVDLPYVLLFSATYLPTAFPSCSVGLKDSPEFTGEEDLIFMTPSQFDSWNPTKIDLAINMVSFQEMTTQQVTEYGNKLLSKSCSVLYSHNLSKSPNNKEITSIESCLLNWSYSHSVDILPMDYTILKIRDDIGLKSNNKIRNSSRLVLKIFGACLNFLGNISKGRLTRSIEALFRPEVFELLSANKSGKTNPIRGSRHHTRYMHRLFYSNLDFKYLD